MAQNCQSVSYNKLINIYLCDSIWQSELIASRIVFIFVEAMSFVKYIQNEQHYNDVLGRITSVKESLWIGTADIKDLYVKVGAEATPFLGILAELIRRGVDVRLIHAKEPGPNFREDFDRYPILFKGLKRVLCPRVHFKMMVFDYKVAYIGSANLTGAGIGMKSSTRRNFEAGILTDDPGLLDAATEQFDAVWTGKHCKGCGRKELCADPVK